MIAILDYGSGNLRSAQRAFETSGREVVITSDYQVALNADGLVVPGVGAFAACMEGLITVRGDQIVRERFAAKRPTLGICVGMQILFARGIEHGEHAGVGMWGATVEKGAAPPSEPPLFARYPSCGLSLRRGNSPISHPHPARFSAAARSACSARSHRPLCWPR